MIVKFDIIAVTCGMLRIILKTQAIATNLEHLLAVLSARMGYRTAINLSNPIKTRIKVDKYKENISRNLKTLQAMFPATH